MTFEDILIVNNIYYFVNFVRVKPVAIYEPKSFDAVALKVLAVMKN